MLYFDHNATSPLSTAARAAWLEAAERFIGNPSSPHRLGARAEAALNDARERLGAILGCAAHELIFTSGATEANNTALHHLSLCGDDEVWISSVEHPSALAAAQRWFPKRHRLIPATAGGVADLQWIEESLRTSRPTAVVLMAANNETGALQPWREVRELCVMRETPFLCDAAQWVGKMPAAGIGECELASGCAHKFGGPAGVGFLKSARRIRPLLAGGGQEDGQRAGTENLPGVQAMLAALEEREQSLSAGLGEKLAIRREFEAQLLQRVPGIRIVAENQERLWNTVSVIMPEIDCRQRWVVKLDRLGFAVSTGSACASGKEKPSHVLAAMGIQSEEAARVLRFSSGFDTTAGDWAALLDGIQRAVEEVKKP